MHRLMILALIIGLVGPLASAQGLAGPLEVLATDDPVSLATIIEALEKNEALYNNLDVTLRTHYTARNPRLGLAPDPNAETTISEELATHQVSRGPLFRVEIEGNAEGDDGRKFTRDRIAAFDGATFRLYDKQRATGEVTKGKSNESDLVRPHMLPLRGMTPSVPLSTYLSGQAAMKAHPQGRLQPGVTIASSYEGRVEYQGMKCHRVWITTSSGDRPHDRWELWLAEERNYLPVRMLAHTFRHSETEPIADGFMEDLREIRPGVWFPFKARVTTYDPMAMQAGRNKEFQWEKRYEMTNVSLEPRPSPESFRKVEFPDGTQVLEIEDGKINRSYIKGTPD